MSSKLEKENIFLALEGLEENISLLRRELEGIFGFQENDHKPSLNLKPNKDVELKCSYCNKVVDRPTSKIYNNNRVFCNKECFSLYRKSTRVERTCPICKTVFFVPPSRLKLNKYCSSQCRDKARKARKVYKACEHCGKEFYTWRSIVKAGGARFCSIKCKNEHLDPDKYVKINCRCCGKAFVVRKKIMKKENRKYCSLECYHKHRNATVASLEKQLEQSRNKKSPFSFLKIFKK